MRNNNMLFLLFMVCFLSCDRKQTISINQDLIKSISTEDSNLPSRFFNILFFCKCQKEEIYILNVYELREIYTKDYSQEKNYKAFLTELFNQKLIVKCSPQSKKFKINEEVKENYLKMTLDDFISFYCNKKSKDIFWLKEDISNELKNSILYFLFINNYLTNIDDYNGEFVIKKIS